MNRRPKSLYAAGILAAGSVLGLSKAASAQPGPQNWLHPAGIVAKMQLELFNLTLYLMIGIFVIVSAILIYTLWRFRARGRQVPLPAAASAREAAATGEGSHDLPPQFDNNHTLEIIWTAIPVLILLVMAVATVRINYSLAAPPPEDPLEVRVVAHQWWWEFEYPELGIVTANDLHIPVGKPVQITLESGDVIHKFWVPRLAGKLDAIPGRINQKWLQADEEGVFYGQCAELCGASHALMRFRVIAHEPETFEAWAAAWGKPPSAEEARDPEAFLRGQELFMAKGCNACHTIDGTAAMGTVGPNLTGFGQRLTVAAGIMDNTAENLARWLSDPPAIKPGSLMPNLGLTRQEVDDLVAFLHDLR